MLHIGELWPYLQTLRYAGKYARTKQANVFVPGKPFKPSLVYAGKAKTYLKATSVRPALALLANIMLSWKRLPGTNSRAYSAHL